MKIDISQKQILEFLIEVDGTNIDEVKSRLILSENDLMIGVDGKTSIQDDGQAKLVFSIPELKNIIKSQNVGARIEMFVENKFYVPYETSIEIERPVTFKVNESKGEGEKTPFSVRDAKIIVEKEEPKTQSSKYQKDNLKIQTPNPSQPEKKVKPQKEPIIENEQSKNSKPSTQSASSFDFNKLLSEFEVHGDLDQLKQNTIESVKKHPVYRLLSEDSKERIAVLKSKRVKTEELYFNIMKTVLSEMTKHGVAVILE
jgi:hypothetical protein